MCSKLSELYESGTLKLYRGTVSRTRLEDDLEAPRQRFLDAVRRRPEAAPGRCILRFDEVLERRGHGTVWEEKVPAIRRELKRLARTGKLPVNEQGDLNRQGILKNFGLGHRMSVHIVQKRAPKLKALLDDYDTTQEDPNYTQYKYDSLSDRLKELLAQPGLELTHSRLISLTALARRMRTSVSALQITPKLRQLIEEKQHQIDQQLRRGSSSKSFRAGGIEHINLGATPYSREHRRVFDFSGLIPLYSLEFAEKVGTLFIAAAARKSSAKELYRSIRRFLLWLAKNEPHVSQQLKDGQDVPRAAFERAGLTYQQKLILEAQLQKSTQGTKCDPGFAIIEQLGGLGLFPRVRFPRRQDRHRNRAASASAGLVEAQHKANEEDVVAELALEEAAYRGIEFDSGKDAIAFARTLARERAKRDDLPASLPTAIAVLCEERLAEIRRAASETFEEWREHYLAGRDLIQSAQPSGEEIVEALTRERARGIHRREWKNFVANIFPLSDPKRALANLLADDCPDLRTVSADIAALATELAERAAALRARANPGIRERMAREGQELRARKVLAEHEQIVLDEIERKRKHAAYDLCLRQTSTNAIAIKSSQLTRKAVTGELKESFRRELVHLGFRHVDVELEEAGGEKGVLYHRLVLKRAPRVELPNVVSEGEQRCLAIASFLAELSTAHDRSTIRQRTTSLGGTSLMVHKVLALHLAAESRDNHASANSLRSRRDDNVHVSKLGRD